MLDYLPRYREFNRFPNTVFVIDIKNTRELKENLLSFMRASAGPAKFLFLISTLL